MGPSAKIDSNTWTCCSTQIEWTARWTGSEGSRTWWVAALIRPIGLFKGEIKVLIRLQIVKGFLLPHLICELPLYHPKKVIKKVCECTDRLLVDWTFGKRLFLQHGLRLLILEPTHCMHARTQETLQRNPALEIIRELRTTSYQE